MASIRDYAVTIEVTGSASIVCEMPTHQTGDVLLAFANKDAATAFTVPAGWEPVRLFAGTGEYSTIITKRAASGSETLTLTLSIDQANIVVVAVKDVEAAVDSGAGALQINVVLAALTYTRTTGSFTTDGFSVGQSVLMSGFTNAGNNGIKEIVSITGSGTILTVTSATTLVNETGNSNERVISTGLDKSARTAANDSTMPYGGSSVTPIANDCLMFHLLGGDAISAPSPYPGWVNLWSGDNAASSLSVSYSFQKTAGAVTGPNSWSLTADDTTAMIVAVRDSGSRVTVPAYIAPGTTPSVMISPLVGVNTVDRGAWELTTNDITSIGGKTMNQVDFVSAADSGYNPFRSATRVVAASSLTVLTASEMRFTSAEDFTAQAGVIFGTFRPQVPRDYLDMAKPVNGGGAIIVFADAENDYKAWVVAGQFSKTTDPSNRGNYAIQVQGSSDTSYATSGSIAWNAINDVYLGGAGYFGACSIEWSELYLLNETIILGGSATTPMEFDEIVRVINNGNGIIPVAQQAGAVATLWTRIRFGGADSTFTNVNLRTFQYPKKADEIDYLDFHVDNNHMGIEFYGLSGDSFSFTNCVFTSDSPYYWRFNSSLSGCATLVFSGSSVVNATVTLRSTSDLDGVIFIDCPTFTQNSATITNGTFDGTKVTSAAPADVTLISNTSFTSAGTGHAIEVGGTAATITLTNVTFIGYSGTSTDAAIYVNIASGTMVINVSGGTIPSIRTAGATVTVESPVTFSVTVKDLETGLVIPNARVMVPVTSSANFPYLASVTITSSGTTATVTHTGHGRATNDNILIAGANEDDYNGAYAITKIDANSYSYTMLGDPANTATGTITATMVLLNGLTGDPSGVITDSRTYTAAQPVSGWVRKATGSPLYRQAPVADTVSNTAGLSVTVFLQPDE